MAFDPTKSNLGADLLTSPTASTRDVWQEAFKRFPAVPEAKVLRASEALSGMNGSWAAQYVLGPSVVDTAGSPEDTTPVNFRMKFNSLGRPGMPEIDFVPYCYGTNRFGNKGGALLGSPISFSIVGPTAKIGHRMTWQWTVDFGANSIRLDTIGQDVNVSPVAIINPFTKTLTDLYHITDLSRFDGGLYVLVTETGSAFQFGANPSGGIGDGAIILPVIPDPADRKGIVPITNHSKFEIFRVVDLILSGGFPVGFVLDSNKLLSEYFTSVGNTSVIRHITLIEPAATRLLAVPDSGEGKGREQVFVFAPPRHALTPEFMPPAEDWIDNTSTVVEYPWSGAYSQTDARNLFDYDHMPQLPVGRPVRAGSVTTLENGTVVSRETGIFTVGWNLMPGSVPIPPTVGQLVHLYNVLTFDNTLTPDPANPNLCAKWGNILGWFEVIGVTPVSPSVVQLTLQRYPEVNPETGVALWGNDQHFCYTASGVTNAIWINGTVHDPVKTLWTTPYFDPDRVDSTRLTNLIDPRWMERTGASHSTTVVNPDMLNAEQPGLSPWRADKAIFDTSTSNAGADGSNADPGSLLDLGFRVVLFPAKTKSILNRDGDPETIIAPDWDRPITSNEVLIDPTVNEKQFFEVDYANGMVRLSHPPQKKVAGDDGAGSLAPSDDIFVATDDNPRGELVLFAACVPYTQEAGQLGAGPRVTATAASDTLDQCMGVTGVGTGDFHDAYGDRIVLPVCTAITQTINSRSQTYSGQTLILDGLVANQIPQSGFFKLFQYGEPVFSATITGGETSLFGYYGVTEDLGTSRTILHGVHGGGITGTSLVTFTPTDPGYIAIRRELYTPNNVAGIAAIPYQQDLSYGDAQRAGTLRFTGAATTVNLDGSVTVKILENAGVACQQNMDDMFSSWLLEGGVLTGTHAHVPPPTTYYVKWTEATIIYRGQRKTIAAGSVTIAPAEHGYIYIDGSDCSVHKSTTIPLADPEYILLGQYQGFIGGDPGTWDLRYPLLDINRRLDIFVGNRNDGTGTPLVGPHFTTLAAAVDYANKILTPVSMELLPTASGKPDYRVRIRVVGYTDEAEADLPITINTDGLTIESDPVMGDTDLTPTAIRWDAAAVSLIDINGHSDLIFRGLSFNWHGADDEDYHPNRMVFTNTGSISRRVTIENCRSEGAAQGFIYSEGTWWDNCRIVDNHAEDLLDLGILMDSGTMDYLVMTTVPSTSTLTVSSGTIVITDNAHTITLSVGETATIVKGALSTTITHAPTVITLDSTNRTAWVIASGSGTFTFGADHIHISAGERGYITRNGGDDYDYIWVPLNTLSNSEVRGNTFLKNTDVSGYGALSPVLQALADTMTGTILSTGGTSVVVVGGGAPHNLTAGNSVTFSHTLVSGTTFDFAPPETLIAGYAYATAPDSGECTITIDTLPDPTVIHLVDGQKAVFACYRNPMSGWYYTTVTGTINGSTAGGIVVFTDFGDMPSAGDYGALIASLELNSNNQVTSNQVNGFHTGIWLNNSWHTDISDNHVLETQNIGVIAGPWSSENCVDHNLLEHVCIEDNTEGNCFRYPAYQGTGPLGPIHNRFGILTAGMNINVRNNLVGTNAYPLIGTSPSDHDHCFDIWSLLSAYSTFDANMVVSIIGGGGLSLAFSNNYADTMNVAVAWYSTLEHNALKTLTLLDTPYLYASGNTVVDGASLSALTTSYSTNCKFIGNNITGTGIHVDDTVTAVSVLGNSLTGLDVEANYSMLHQNYILMSDELMSVTGLGSVVSDNWIITTGSNDATLFLAGSYHVVSGNHCERIATVSDGTLVFSTIHGNMVSGPSKTTDPTIALDGNSLVIQQNFLGGYDVFVYDELEAPTSGTYTHYLTFEGNVCSGDVTLFQRIHDVADVNSATLVNYVSVCGNKITGNLVVWGQNDQHVPNDGRQYLNTFNTVTGNTLPAGILLIMGWAGHNFAAGPLVETTVNNTVVGNTCASLFQLAERGEVSADVITTMSSVTVGNFVDPLVSTTAKTIVPVSPDIYEVVPSDTDDCVTMLMCPYGSSVTLSREYAIYLGVVGPGAYPVLYENGAATGIDFKDSMLSGQAEVLYADTKATVALCVNTPPGICSDLPGFVQTPTAPYGKLRNFYIRKESDQTDSTTFTGLAVIQDLSPVVIYSHHGSMMIPKLTDSTNYPDFTANGNHMRYINAFVQDTAAPSPLIIWGNRVTRGSGSHGWFNGSIPVWSDPDHLGGNDH